MHQSWPHDVFCISHSLVFTQMSTCQTKCMAQCSCMACLQASAQREPDWWQRRPQPPGHPGAIPGLHRQVGHHHCKHSVPALQPPGGPAQPARWHGHGRGVLGKWDLVYDSYAGFYQSYRDNKFCSCMWMLTWTCCNKIRCFIQHYLI